MTSFDRRVTLDELRELAGRYRNWGTWGPDDERGSLNYLTPERVRAAAGLVRKGAVFSLAIAMDEAGPMQGYVGRYNTSHVMVRDGGDVALAAAPAKFDFT